MMELLDVEPELWHLYLPFSLYLAFWILYVLVFVCSSSLLLWYQAVGCCPCTRGPWHRRVTLSPWNITLQGGSVVSRAISATGEEGKLGQSSKALLWAPKHWDGERRGTLEGMPQHTSSHIMMLQAQRLTSKAEGLSCKEEEKMG